MNGNLERLQESEKLQEFEKLQKLEKLIEGRGAIRKIGVIGMGYVGIPAAALLADVPHFEKVYGFQRNSETSGYKIDMLNSGECPLKGEEPGLQELIGRVVNEGKFECTADFSKISECDAVAIAIQTPFEDPKDLVPDFRALIEGIRQAGRYLTPGTLVVLESTVTPGTTEGMAKDILEEESGLVAGEDFALAHAPERVMVGRLIKNIQEHDRIVGGIDDVSTRRATELYEPLLTEGKIIPMSATAAEVTKTAENTFRDLQIAAVNQLALYCEAMGINVYDVRAGVDSLKGEGITRAMLWPGAGVGGHCLTKDTYHLERGLLVIGQDKRNEERRHEPLDFPEGRESLYVLARAINDFMPEHMLNLTINGLKRAGKKLKGAKVAILGWAFINNSDDARNTPSEVYRDLCLKAGMEVAVHDPHVLHYPGVSVSQDISEVVNGADCVVIFAGHKDYYQLDAGEMKAGCSGVHPVIVDGRNVVDPDEYIREGFVYEGIGRGDKNGHVIVSV